MLYCWLARERVNYPCYFCEPICMWVTHRVTASYLEVAGLGFVDRWLLSGVFGAFILMFLVMLLLMLHWRCLQESDKIVKIMDESIDRAIKEEFGC